MRPALAAIVACLALAAPASAARPWVVSGSLSGTYSNDVAWSECTGSGDTGTSHEALTLRATIAPGRPEHYRSGGIGLPLKMRPGGTWSDGGTFHPLVTQPDGSSACGPPRAYHCGGRVLRRGRALTFLGLQRKGRSLIGGFLGPPYFTEGESDLPCLNDTQAMLGLRDTDIEADALVENDAHPSHLKVPRRLFRRGRPFTIRHVVRPDGGCPRLLLTSCAESGRLTLKLRFSHPRR
ncbi:MAG TPA: hypothetical protein VH418_15300 [Solirubrobacteraceae bacterium]|jgi:hypothetical protein